MTLKPSIAIAWALNGVNVKPDDAKIDSGWIAEKPPFQNENWLQNRSDLWMKSTEERGTPEWDPQIIYGKGARVHFADAHWQSLQISNLSTAPVADAGWWINVNEISSPVGMMVPFASNSIPGGWILCDGAVYDSIANTSLQRLYSKIGNLFGGVDASDFQVPDMVDRAAVGAGGTTTPLVGSTTGNITAIISTQQMPSHAHSFTGDQLPTHNHTTFPANNSTGGAYGMGSQLGSPNPVGFTGEDTAGTPSGTIGQSGSGAPLNIMQPSTGINYIIKI